MQEQVTAINSTLTDLQSFASATDTVIEELENEVSSLKNTLDALSSSAATKADELCSLFSELSEQLKGADQQLTENIAVLEGLLENAQTESEAYRNELTQQIDQLRADLNGRINTINNRIETLSTDVKVWIATAIDGLASKTSLKQEIAALRQQVDGWLGDDPKTAVFEPFRDDVRQQVADGTSVSDAYQRFSVTLSGDVKAYRYIDGQKEDKPLNISAAGLSFDPSTGILTYTNNNVTDLTDVLIEIPVTFKHNWGTVTTNDTPIRIIIRR